MKTFNATFGKFLLNVRLCRMCIGCKYAYSRDVNQKVVLNKSHQQ